MVILPFWLAVWNSWMRYPIGFWAEIKSECPEISDADTLGLFLKQFLVGLFVPTTEANLIMSSFSFRTA